MKTGRRPLLLAAVAVLALPLMGCGERSASTRTELDVPFRADARLDVHVPTRPDRAPVIVTLHGCCGGKHDLTGLAHGLAEQGALVFNASWRDPEGPGTYPAAYERADCAVRFARVQARRYGADPGRVTVLGWSDGAMLAAVLGNASEAFSGPCSAPPAKGGPDAVVSLGGYLGWPLPDDGAVDPLLVNARTTRFFGGRPEERPHAWVAGNPYAHLGQRPEVDIHLVVGADDELVEDNRQFAQAAERAGHPVSLVVTPGGGNQTILATRTPEGATAVHETMRAARGS